MIRCQECQADNLAGSRFCRLCGKPLPLRSPAPRIRPEDIDRVLSEAYRIVHSGDVEEALFLADAVLSVDPENSSGLALKGLCLEKLGDIEGAVEVYEELVLRNPDSPLDRIKLAQLRRKLGVVQKDGEALKTRKALAVVGSILTTLVVGMGGVVFALLQSPSPSPSEKALTAQQTLTGFDLPESPPRSAGTESPPPAEPSSSSMPSGGSNAPAPSFPRSNVPWLPPVNFEISPSPRGGEGALPAVEGSVPPPPPAPASAPEGSREVRPSPGSGDENIMPPPPEPQPRNPGTVIIVPRGEGQDASPRALSENIYRIAQQKMTAGDYAGAIRDFLTALNGSDKPALIHQLVGRCYKKLNDIAKAKEHFEKALSLYEASARAGSEEAKAAMEACRREIQSLGG